jgi:hypothetical protein
VSKVERTLRRILRGNADANIRFDELRVLLTHLGFAERIRGDHHIFTRDGVAEILNLQPRTGKAKPYQVKQVRNVLSSYGFAGESETKKKPRTENKNGDEARESVTEEENDG